MLLSAESPDLLGSLSLLLGGNAVAIVPCDTMYGIVGVAPATAEKIRRLKGRGEDKPFLQLIPDITWVMRTSDFQIPYALAKHWPGPLTVIVPLPEGGSAALRVPDSVLLRSLIEGLGAPLYSTSVNRAGEAPLWRIGDIRREFESEVDAVVDAGDLPNSAPSTIVDATARPFRIVRQGALRLNPAELA
jgi:L-threonylcarbamoyladenylate synthase